MGRKKYFCDYCQRSFNDDPKARSDHLKSVRHIQLKEEHYAALKDASTILREESAKDPCWKFRNDGFCRFGSLCKFTHLMPDDFENLKELSESKAQVPDINDWWQSRCQQKYFEAASLLSYQPPCEASNLPPSLIPFDVAQFLTADIPSWGDDAAEPPLINQ